MIILLLQFCRSIFNSLFFKTTFIKKNIKIWVKIWKIVIQNEEIGIKEKGTQDNPMSNKIMINMS